MNKITKKNDGKPLSTDISGLYKYNAKKNEYIYLNKTFNTKEKKPFNIRLGNYKPTLWVNHTDYTAVQCDYYKELEHYYFTFNCVNYSIPTIPNFSDSLGYYVQVKKVI